MTTIRISAGPVVAHAVLGDTPTARAIAAELPISGTANIWGEEIYFGIPVDADEDDAKAVVELGDIAYWPPGSAFCIFFGPTPASRGQEIRPASPVNVVGRIDGDPSAFRQVRDGSPVLIELVAGQADGTTGNAIVG